MTVSVAVPCLYRDDATERLLSDIRRQSAAGGAELDLVVVEGVSPVGRARNEALRRVRGDYLVWVDADDEIADDWWTSIVHASEGCPDVVVFGWRDEKCEREILPDSQCADATGLFRAVLRDEPPNAYLWNKVIRRDLWNGVCFDESFLFQDDFVVIPQVLCRASRVEVLDKVLYRYRFDSTGVSCKRGIAHLDEVLRARWKRFEDWRESPSAREALVPFMLMCAERFVSVKDRAERRVLHRYARRLFGHLPTVLRCPLCCRLFTLRALLAMCGF